MENIASLSLGEALDGLTAFSAMHPEFAMEDALRAIRNEYRLMFDYWCDGFRDEQLEKVYRNMIVRAYRLAANAYMRYSATHSPFLFKMYNRVRTTGRDWVLASLQGELENYVSDMAMLQLEPTKRRQERKDELSKAHQQYMNDLFDFLCTSHQWADGSVEALEQVLLSPTVDTVDQQLIVSAVMLGAMNMFDINKFRLLLKVYMESADEQVRQRAFVGWVMALGYGMHKAFPEEREMVESLLADERVRKELVELQIQILYCLSAETDNRTIQKEIMPDLLKHNGLNITPNGIEEKDDDAMEDILHPDEAERRMERLEESFRKMMDMQKAGSDIYFGGFSQMKRFPFFDSVSNWFMPFYPEHPAVSAVCGNPDNGDMVRAIVENMPFCDSDKYSFVIAFQQVVNRIPQNIREMLTGGNIMGTGMVSADERRTPAYIRRIYLQDLYRFFRLFPSRSQFYNPFGTNDGGKLFNYIFFANPIFRGTALESCFGEIASCLLKRKMRHETVTVLDNYSEKERDYLYYMLCGNVTLEWSDVSFERSSASASACFASALRLKPDDVKALSGLARANFYEGEYTIALDAYNRLTELRPANRSFVLNKTVCLVNLERYEEALKLLYQLNYEAPEDERANRVMARALMCTGKYEKAGKIYSEICVSASCEHEDMANYGLNEWFGGNKRAAAIHFADYLHMRYGKVGVDECRKRFGADILGKESKLLAEHGITPTDALLMGDLVCEVIFPEK